MIYDNIIVEVLWINSETYEEVWVQGELRPEGAGVKWHPLADNTDSWCWPCWWSDMRPSNVRLVAAPRQSDNRFSVSDRKQLEMFPLWASKSNN